MLGDGRKGLVRAIEVMPYYPSILKVPNHYESQEHGAYALISA